MQSKITTYCNRCDELKECELISDPFLIEVCPEDNPEPEWWCENCADARRDDI